MAVATKMSANKSFNEQNKSCSRALSKNCFMLIVRISSYGCAGKSGGQERSVYAQGAAESNSSFLSAL